MNETSNGCELLAQGPVSVFLEPDAPFSPTPSERRDIDREWERMREENPDLTNGRIFIVSRIERPKNEETVVYGGLAQYKHYAVQGCGGLDFGLFALAVSGLCLFEDDHGASVLFARRSALTLQTPGLWEAVPSGGVDAERIAPDGTVDCEAKILDEFAEETGLSRDLVRDVALFALIRCREQRLYEIGCALRIPPPPPACLPDSAEYADFVFIPEKECLSFLRQKGDQAVPTSLTLAKAWLAGVKPDGREG